MFDSRCNGACVCGHGLLDRSYCVVAWERHYSQLLRCMLSNTVTLHFGVPLDLAWVWGQP